MYIPTSSHNSQLQYKINNNFSVLVLRLYLLSEETLIAVDNVYQYNV